MDAELRDLCERLRGLLAKAKDRPWRTEGPRVLHATSCGIVDCCGICECTHGSQPKIAENHAALIVAAINALPRLLDTIAAQAAELEGVRAMLELQQPGATTNSSSFIPIADSNNQGDV